MCFCFVLGTSINFFQQVYQGIRIDLIFPMNLDITTTEQTELFIVLSDRIRMLV
jgi:hypothetical protein